MYKKGRRPIERHIKMKNKEDNVQKREYSIILNTHKDEILAM